MIDYISLMTTTPVDESCAQVGMDDYLTYARLEANAYIRQLERVYGGTPSGCYFRTVKCPHDFGTYLDIRFYYDDEEQVHVKYLDQVESGCCLWDEQAKEELEQAGYFLHVQMKAHFKE